MKNKVFIILIFVIITIMSTIYLFSPLVIVLNNDKVLEVTYNTEYKEPGAYVKKLFFKLKKEIIVTNNIDTSILGDYVVNYQIKDTKITEKRTIKVVDNVKPEIILKGDSVYTIFKNEEYIEAGFAVNDNYDGDLTKEVTVTDNVEPEDLGKFQVVYKVCDSNKNCSEVTRKVIVTKGDILYGNFRDTDIDSYYQSTLKLRGSDRTFIFTVNLCEGLGSIDGTYTVNEDVITLTVSKKSLSDFKGFTGLKKTYKFVLTEEKDTLKYDSSYIACSPQEYDLFVKYN